MNTIRLRPTCVADLDFVLATESAYDRFVVQWPLERHQAALSDPDQAHLIVETLADGKAVGYLILAGRASPARCIELVRIAVTDPGRGFGRAALDATKNLVFKAWKAHRLWLDVYDSNARAKRLYEAAGFLEEGVLRECVWVSGRYESLVVMGMLEHEFASRRLG